MAKSRYRPSAKAREILDQAALNESSRGVWGGVRKRMTQFGAEEIKGVPAMQRASRILGEANRRMRMNRTGSRKSPTTIRDR